LRIIRISEHNAAPMAWVSPQDSVQGLAFKEKTDAARADAMRQLTE